MGHHSTRVFSFWYILEWLVKIYMSYVGSSRLFYFLVIIHLVSKNGRCILSYHRTLCIDCHIVISWQVAYIRINLNSHYWVLKLFDTIVLSIFYNLRSVNRCSVECSISWNIWLYDTLWEVVRLIICCGFFSLKRFLIY